LVGAHEVKRRGSVARSRAIFSILTVGLTVGSGCSLIVRTDDLSGGASDASGPPLEDSTTAGDVQSEAPPADTDAGLDATALDAGGGDTGADAKSIADGAADVAAPDATSGDGNAADDGNGAEDAGAPVPDAAGDAAISCDAGIPCNGVCVDPTRDPNNCNGCGNVCASGACGTSIAADMTTMPAGWQFNGSASFDPTTPSAVLTPAVLHLSGTLVFGHPIVVDAFDATFQFRIGFQSQTRCDGMGFMFERQGPTALGASGGALGMVGLDGYAVELDIYNNGLCGDANGNHIGVDSLSLCDPNDVLPTSLFASPDLTGTVDLGDGTWHALAASLQAGAMSVTVDGHPAATNVSLPGLVSGTPYYFGFGAGTGGLQLPNGKGGFRMEVRNVVISFPTPRCL
jgi:hypothetical protein